MAIARRLLQAQLHAISRRTGGRCFYLAPNKTTNALLRYAWILIAARFQDAVTTYGFFFLSNHYHTLTRDLSGGADSALPAYFRDLNSLLARALNVQLGRDGPLWGPGSYANVEVHDQDAELAQLLYLMAQPVASCLTRTAEEWPGEKFLPEQIGTVQTARRPDEHPFFASSRPRGPRPETALRAELSAQEKSRRETKESKAKRGKCRKRRKLILQQQERRQAHQPNQPNQPLPKRRKSTLPETVSYRIPVPQALAHLPLSEARATLRRLHDAHIAQLQAQHRAEGRSYLGVRKILAQSPSARPPKDAPKFKLNPRIAASTKSHRLTLYGELAGWRDDHAEGVELLESETPWRARFPLGTHRRAQELRRILLAHRSDGPPGRTA